VKIATPLAVLFVAAAIAAIGDAPESLTYDVAAVDGKLFLETEPEARRLGPGDEAVSGDRLRTGSSSSATIGVPSHTTVFRLGAKTTCTLAHDRPGVLLHVERGRLRAIFGAFSGTEPRLVTTPSAVLAVRGTEYGLRVTKNGSTQIVVFEGVVEVTDPAGRLPPTRVEAGQQTNVRQGRPVEMPVPHRLSPADWDRGLSAPPPGMSGTGMPQGVPGGPTGAGAAAGQGGSKRRGG
jgi:hypothetical protein